MCVCVYVCGYVRICVYMCVFACIYIYMCVCLCDVYVCICVYMCVYVMFMRVYVCACVFMCTYIYVSVYTLAGLVGILPAYSDSYADFLNEPRNFFKRPKLWKPLPVQRDGILRMYYSIRLLGSWNSGHRSWPEIPSKEIQWHQHIAPKTSFFIPKFAGFCTGWKLGEQWYHLKFQHPNLNILNQTFSLPDSYVYMIFSWWMGWPFSCQM